MSKILPDFDILKKMAEDEPDKLEELKREIIQEIIDEAKDDQSRRRLEGLQWQIDSHIRMSKNPLDATIKISNMMHNSFQKLRDALNEVSGYAINDE